MEEGDIVIRISKHLIKWCPHELAATNDGYFDIVQFYVVASEKPVNGGRGGRIEFGIFA